MPAMGYYFCSAMKFRFLIFIILIPTASIAAPKKELVDLSDAIKMATQSGPDILVERAKVATSLADISRAKAEKYPRLHLTAGVGPATQASGDAVTGFTNSDEFGLSFLGSLEFSQPIYTWGRIDSAIEAAKNGKRVSEQGVLLKKIDTIYDVKKSYYGYLLAKSLKKHVDSAEEGVRKALKDLKGTDGVQSQRYRLGILLSQIEAKRSLLEKEVELAKTALNFHMGRENGNFVPKELELEYAERKLESLEHYLKLVETSRPEHKQLEAGIRAKKALAFSESRGDLPVFGLIAKYDFSATPIREDQSSPYAYDPFNKSEVVVGLGLTWNFQWGLQSSKAEKLRAEAAGLEAQRGMAKEGFKLLVKKAWLEVREAVERVKAAKRGYRIGKKWFDKVMVGFKIGSVDAGQVAPAYQARAETLKEYYEALFDGNMAWAGLAKAVGNEIDPNLNY